jgi:hypothetical protein
MTTAYSESKVYDLSAEQMRRGQNPEGYGELKCNLVEEFNSLRFTIIL